MRRAGLRFGFALTAAGLVAGSAVAQELEARLYGNAPVGVNLAGFGYGYSAGNVLLDAALPVADAEAQLHTMVGVYVRTLDVLGKSARADVIVPFAIGDWSGLVNGQRVSTSRAGFGDARVRLVVNLLGAPALTPAQFRTYRQKTIVGVSVQVYFPVGQYEAERLISLGSNRWTLRAELGLSQAVGQWTFELAPGVWWFEDNDDYLGQTVEQRPFWAVQSHIIYTFRPGLWVSFDAGYGDGGRSTSGGVARADPKTNTRLGGTFSYPLTRRDGLKLTLFTGLSTRFGADFDNIGIVYVRSF